MSNDCFCLLGGCLTRSLLLQAIDMAHHLFPAFSHLVARGAAGAEAVGSALDTVGARTWSSSLFEKVRKRAPRLAATVKEWTLLKSQHHAADPKGHDDPEAGGEWFAAWLRAAHRDIYRDIDTSDCSELLRIKWARSLTRPKDKKYKLGDITVPSCAAGFADILATWPSSEGGGLEGNVARDRAEVQAKILIDIYMTQLVDFSCILKVLQLVSAWQGEPSECCSSSGPAAAAGGVGGEGADAKPVVVVCYLGAMHTRALEEFFCRCSFCLHPKHSPLNEYRALATGIRIYRARGINACLSLCSEMSAKSGGFEAFRSEFFFGKYEWEVRMHAHKEFGTRVLTPAASRCSG